MENKSLVGLIAIILTLTGVPTMIYFYPYFIEQDTCVKSGSYGPWENVTEKVYYNETFPAIARYYCAKETAMTREDCHKQNKLINNPGCKWGGKVGGTTKLYVMEDPEVSYSLESVDSLPLVDVGLVKTEGVKMDWIEEGLTHRCLRFEITKGISTAAVAGIILDTASKANANPLLLRRTIENYNETGSVQDKCSTVQIGTSPNGTAIMNTTCTTKVVTEAKQREAWNDVKIDITEISKDRFDSVFLQDGIYDYCINTPIVNKGNGVGNSGAAKIVLGSKIYEDRQHSSVWETDCTNWVDVNITNKAGRAIQDFDYNFTVDTTGANWQINSGEIYVTDINAGTESDRKWINLTAFNSATTHIKTFVNLSATSGSLRVYYGCNVGVPKYPKNQTYTFWDDFSVVENVGTRGDFNKTGTGNWIVNSSGGYVSTTGGTGTQISNYIIYKNKTEFRNYVLTYSMKSKSGIGSTCGYVDYDPAYTRWNSNRTYRTLYGGSAACVLYANQVINGVLGTVNTSKVPWGLNIWFNIMLENDESIMRFSNGSLNSKWIVNMSQTNMTLQKSVETGTFGFGYYPDAGTWNLIDLDNVTMYKYEFANQPNYSISEEQTPPAEFTITINQPTNRTVVSGSSVNLNFSVIGDASSYLCNISIDGNINQTNVNVSNATNKIVQLNGTGNLVHWWKVFCSSAGTTEQTAEYSFGAYDCPAAGVGACPSRLRTEWLNAEELWAIRAQ